MKEVTMSGKVKNGSKPHSGRDTNIESSIKPDENKKKGET